MNSPPDATMLRAIPSFMNTESVARIDVRLEEVRREHVVAIPLAIESGSRAWGFPSPDSDYDCRFIFVRGQDDYLSLFDKRDVIETPLDGELDVNGWDVAKAIKLLLKGNAVVIEWLTSPIVYAGNAWFAESFLALARDVADRAAIAKHYLHLGERQRRTHFTDGRPVALKKMFYALRPAAALRWLRTRPDEGIAPMHFPKLIAECGAPRAVVDLSAELIARKAETRELGDGELPAPVAAFIDEEFALARDAFEGAATRIAPAARAQAQTFFLDVLSRIRP
jgi:predicted nucleotidyltransferase